MKKYIFIYLISSLLMINSGCAANVTTQTSDTANINSETFSEPSIEESKTSKESEIQEVSKFSYESIDSETVSSTTSKELTNIDESKTESLSEFSIPNSSTEYDSLQKVFLELNFNITQEDIENMVEEYNLEYTKQDYNGSPQKTTYKLAYNSDVALQKYADEGDNIEITFNKKDKSFMYAEYSNKSTFMVALFYNYGILWDFSFKEPENKYSGYYFYKPGDSQKNGIILEYSNGNTTETNYHRCNSAENTLKNVIGED